MSKATVVSCVPFPIMEHKPVNPGTFIIKAAKISQGEIEILVLDDASFNLRLDDTRGNFTVPVLSHQLAKSLINDYTEGFIEVTLDARPGLFFVEGEFTAKEIKEKFPEKVQEALRIQTNWFKKLVDRADDDWAKFGQKRAISDIQRFAAAAINVDRPWMHVKEDVKIETCPGCGTRIAPNVAVCASCGAILNKVMYDKLDFVGKRA